MDKLKFGTGVQDLHDSERKFPTAANDDRSNLRRRLAQRRRVVWLGLTGFVVGGIVGYLVGVRLVEGWLLGGTAGAAVGWALYRWENWRHE